MNRRTLTLLLLIGLLSGACSAAGNSGAATPTLVPTVLADTSIIAEGRVEPLRYGEIAFTTGGLVSEVLVKEGEAVRKGQALIRLGGETDTNYAAAQLELASAEKALNDLKNSAGTDLAQVIIDLKDAEEAVVKAENYLRYLQNSKKVPQTETRLYYISTGNGYDYRTRTKFFKGPAPKGWIIEAENDLALKKAEVDAAQRRYDRLKDGVDREQLAVLEARLNAARAQVDSFTVLAPFDGVVTSLPAKVGNSIRAGETAVTVADFSEWLVETTDLTEIDVVELAEGQPVIVTLDAIPGEEMSGRILSIGKTYSENQGDVVYEVTILLIDTHPAMRWGMTAAARFENQD